MLTASIGPALVEIAGHAGFDFVVFDNEHCPIAREPVIAMVRAAEPAGVPPDGATSLGRPQISVMWLWRNAMLCHVGTRVRPSTVVMGRPARSGFSSEEYAS